MPLPIKLPIFYHTDNTRKLESMEMDDSFSIEECDEKEMTFYVVNAVAPYEENGITYSSIHTNGTMFICPYDPDRVNNLIQ